jgi:hypothetical protein
MYITDSAVHIKPSSVSIVVSNSKSLVFLPLAINIQGSHIVVMGVSK